MDRQNSKKVGYRGIIKHKQWKPGGGFGTLCPNWTHQSSGRGFAGDPDCHDWSATVAHELFESSVSTPDGHHYAARDGISFKAFASNDGTWHGFPIPWHEVPIDVQDVLIERHQATRREIKRQRSVDTGDIRWALKGDEE